MNRFAIPDESNRLTPVMLGSSLVKYNLAMTMLASEFQTAVPIAAE